MKLAALSVIGVLCLIGPPTVRADVPNKARAKKLNREGKELFDQRKYGEALKKFRQARLHWEHRALLINIALTRARLGQHVAAAKLLRLYVKKTPPPIRKVPAFLKTTVLNTALTYARVGQPLAAVEHLKLYLKIAKPSERKVPALLRKTLFNIALDYARLGQPIASVEHLRLYLKIAKPSPRKVPAVLARMRQQVGILVVRVVNRKVGKGQKGKVDEVLDWRAEIWIDSQRKSSGRAELVLMPGSKKVAIKLGGKVIERRIVRVVGGKETRSTVSVAPPLPKIRVRPRLRIPAFTPPPPKRPRVAGVVPTAKKPATSARRTLWTAILSTTFGVGLALLVAGGGTGLHVLNLEAEKDKKIWEIRFVDSGFATDGDACKEAEEKGYSDVVDVCDRGRRFAIATTVMLITGGALAGISATTALILYLVHRRKAGKKRDSSKRIPLSLSPVVRPGGASLTLGLEF